MTARAVASLAELVEIGLPLVAPGGVLVAWKRGPLEDELAAAAPALAALRAGSVTVHDDRRPGPGGAPAGRRSTPRPHRPAVPARPRGTSPTPLVNSGPATGPRCATLPGMRVAVLSDIHANLPALEAVLAAMPSVDEVWQLGDIVGLRAGTGRGRRRGCARSGRSASAATTTPRPSAGPRSSRSTSMRATRCSGRGRRSATRPGRGSRRSRSGCEREASRWSTAARGTPSGSTSPPRRWPGRGSPRWRPPAASTATPTSRSPTWRTTAASRR